MMLVSVASWVVWSAGSVVRTNGVGCASWGGRDNYPFSPTNRRGGAMFGVLCLLHPLRAAVSLSRFGVCVALHMRARCLVRLTLVGLSLSPMSRNQHTRCSQRCCFWSPPLVWRWPPSTRTNSIVGGRLASSLSAASVVPVVFACHYTHPTVTLVKPPLCPFDGTD